MVLRNFLISNGYSDRPVTLSCDSLSESKLATYPGLYPLDGIWYVRKRVPIELCNVFTSDIRKSLDVGDKRSSIRLYAGSKTVPLSCDTLDDRIRSKYRAMVE